MIKNRLSLSNTTWNLILVFSAIFSSFFIPMVSGKYQSPLFALGLTIMFISGVFSLEKDRKYLLLLSLLALLLQWISEVFDLTVLSEISKVVNIIFFIIVVFFLITQMAMSKKVTPKVILASISGYLLLGLVFSIIVSAAWHRDPSSFNFPVDLLTDSNRKHYSEPLYFSFITLTTTGFGDFLPLKPYSRAITTMIAVAGQLYIAVIVAMLVGKFAASQENEKI
jgi:voltage-gated potassium channel